MKLRSAVLLACLAVVPLLAMFSHKIPREWRIQAWRVARGESAIAEAAPSDDAPSPVPVAPSEPPPTTTPASVEAQLQQLGAVSVECVPLAGGTIHRCSCRVAADPSGQLQRVFQTSNADPAVGMRNLLGQVQFWKYRHASQTAADGGRPVRDHDVSSRSPEPRFR